jgi:energy-coupling factor transport system permease protein
MFNARAWLIWTLAALTAAMVATNPLYLIIVLMCAALVRVNAGTGNSMPVWRFGLSVIVFSTFYNALLTHFGDTVLVMLPRAIPLIGGPVTLEAAAFGASRGLALWAILAVSSTFSDVLSPYELVRLTPRFLRQAGLVISIALAFVPQTLRSFRQVREAQAIRGHQLRGIRDLTALVVPLLTDSLEKAVQLAEAMEARGYGTARAEIQNPKHLHRTQVQVSEILTVGGLIGILLGWLVEAYWRNGVGWGIIVLGALALGFGIRAMAQHAPQTTHYKRQTWSSRDTLLAASSATVLAIVMAFTLFDPQLLAFYPYPRAALPPFDARIGLTLALLAAPAFIRFPGRTLAQPVTSAGK